MKNIKSFLLLTISVIFSMIATAQDRSAAELKTLVESQNFVFKAERVYPQAGSSRILTPQYDLTVSKDKVISYLPYFGRSYVPTLSADGGIKFTSDEFDYKMISKGDKWEVSIKPKDANGVQQMELTIFDNGRASLNVINTTRDGISYDGYIQGGGRLRRGF